MYVLAFIRLYNPYIFGFGDEKSHNLFFISVAVITLLFPMIALALMKPLGLITSIQLHDRQERIGPLIATGIFYLWLYVNIRQNDAVPFLFSSFLLGVLISLFTSLVINSFSKISIHTVAMGGWFCFMGIFIWYYNYEDIGFSFYDMNIILSKRSILISVLLFSGLVGTARLYLKSHTYDEIFGGYIVGIIAQIIAFRLYLPT